MLRWFMVWVISLGLETGFVSAQAPLPVSKAPDRGVAERGLPIFQQWFAKDYRSHHEVVHATQSAEGTMLFASLASVLEFDGVRWSKHLIPGAWVKQVALGPDGHVYVAADGEFGRLERTVSGGREYRSFVGLVPTNLMPFGVVRTIAARPDGIYFSAQTGVFRWKDNALQAWPIEGGKQTYLLSDGPDLWLSNPAKGLHRFDGTAWPLISDDPRILANPRVCLARLPSGLRLMGLFRAGVFQWDGARLQPWTNAVAEELKNALIMDLQALPDGRVMVATGQGGLWILDGEGRLLQRFEHGVGLNNDTVFDLAADRAGGIWMGTRNGVARWDPELSVTRFDTRLGFPEALVLGFLRHREVLHVMLTGVGVYRLLPNTNTVAGGRFEPLPVDIGTTYRAASHPDGLLLGSDRGLFLWDGTSARRVIKPSGNVRQVHLWKRDPQIVLVGTDSSAHVIRMEGKSARELATWPLGGECLRLGEDPEGAFWIGVSARGFARISPPVTRDDWASVRLDIFDTSRGLGEKDSFFQFEEGPGGLFFLSDRAGYRFDAAAGRFVVEDRFKIGGQLGLYFGLQAASEDGTMWGGVTRVGSGDIYSLPWPFGSFRRTNEGAFEWRSAPASWNALIGEQGPYATFCEGSGESAVLWIAGESSLLRVGEVGRDRPRPEFPLQLAGPRVGTRLYEASARNTLRFTREPITFHVMAPRLDLGASVQYQSRLLGFHDDWSEPTVNREISYSGLSGGPFVLETRAIDADGRTSEPARSVFEVAPPWYRSGRALAGYALMALMGIQSFVRWRLSRSEQRRRELEELVAVRTRELAEARDAAEEASRAKSRFLANMSHELRTPLNGVLGFSQLLAHETELSDRNRERIRLIRSSGDHLLGLINDVLDLSKVEAGRVELRLAPVDLGALIRELGATFAPRATQRGLQFEMELQWPESQSFMADGQRVRQVLENLLGNALKFTRTGSVRLEATRQSDGACRFAVSDTGAGMSAEDCARLFQPFSQAVSGRPPEPGAGLGLAISQHLVGLMGGRIEVSSELGKGSRFEFRLAFEAAGSAITPASSQVRAWRRYRGPRRRVLVVDDLEVNRRLLRELLEGMGFEVVEADGGDRALEGLGSHEFRPDLVILDLRMPGMDGFELTRRLRAMPGGTALKIIATSASIFSFARADALKLGCDDFLPKPFQEEHLRVLLESILALEWERMPGESALTSVGEAGVSEAVKPWNRDVLQRLLEAANRGDVAAVRTELTLARVDGLGPRLDLEELDALAARFQMALLRERLAKLLPD